MANRRLKVATRIKAGVVSRMKIKENWSIEGSLIYVQLLVGLGHQCLVKYIKEKKKRLSKL